MGQDLIRRYKPTYSSAMECLETDLEACLAYRRFPEEHERYIRTTNLLERTFGEGRRRTKVIPRFPNERSCLKLVYAVMIDVSKKWRGIRMNVRIGELLSQIRQKLFGVKEAKLVS